jgi:prenyltransferase beta subunit
MPFHSNLQKKGELEYWLTEHLRLNGVYWGLNALFLLGEPHALDRDEIIKYVLSCQTEEGAFPHEYLMQVVLALMPDMTLI